MSRKAIIGLLTSLLMAAGAPAVHAIPMLIDGFGDPAQGPITAGPSSTSDSSGPVSITDTDLSNAARTLQVDWDSGSGSVEIASNEFGAGFLSYSQNSLAKGQGMARWSFDAEDLSGLLGAIRVKAVEIDPGTAMDVDLIFELSNSSDSSSQALTRNFTSTVIDELVFYSFADFDAIDLSSIDGAKLTIDGRNSTAVDVSVDFVGTSVPEPSTLLLLGASLIGLGIVGRRRAAN